MGSLLAPPPGKSCRSGPVIGEIPKGCQEAERLHNSREGLTAVEMALVG